LIPLLKFFVDLCLLRAAPQDLPASRELFALVLALNVLVGVIVQALISTGVGRALVISVFDAGLLLLLLWGVLYLRSRPMRFAQTATALLGAGALLAAVYLPLHWLTGPDPQASILSQVGALLILGLMGWIQVVTGHILRHALDVHLAVGVVLSLGYTLVSMLLFELLFLSPA
jgi:predicted membrane channel-forming protein YqfA (hemolysin III family)